MGNFKHRLCDRPRRVIYNDDAGPRFTARTREELLGDRFNATVGTDVDTYFKCVVSCWDPSVPALEKAEQYYIEAAREHDMEVWASIRMNDVHDAHWPKEIFDAPGNDPVDLSGTPGWDSLNEEQRYVQSIFRPHRLKQSNPEMLLGEARMRNNYDVAPLLSIQHMTWSAFNYAYPRVRKYFLDMIEDWCRTHDWDGVELDFIRMPVFFKAGEIEQNIPTMSGFMNEVRALLDRIGAERGRPYPIAVHVPDAPKYCLRCGLDIQHWLANDLVDLVVMGTAYRSHVQSYNEFASLCHYHGVPVYPCFNCGPIASDETIDGAHVIERFRARACGMMSEDVDGIAIFNLFASAVGGGLKGPLDELTLIGDPVRKMDGLDKLYEAGTMDTWVDREILADPPQRPRVVDQEPLTLKVGDPLECVAREGRLAEVRLDVRVSQMLEEESVIIKLNGQVVPIVGRREQTSDVAIRGLEPGGWWFEAVADAPPARQGINHVVVMPGPGCFGKAISRVQNVHLWVRYKR
jgi:hypothetical protein